MSKEMPGSISEDTPNFVPKVYSIGLIIAVIVLTGFWLISRFTATDLARDVEAWQEKLNLIAESRTSEVNHWVSAHFKNLRSLAGNPSLQLYLTELQATGSGSISNSTPSGLEPGQKTYLRNLILFSAEQSGFGLAATPAINANVPQDNKNGLAVLNKDNQIVVSTPLTQAMASLMTSRARKNPLGHEYLIDIQKDEGGTLYMGFAVPIFAIQGERNAESQIGQVIGLKAISDNFFSLLKHPGVTEQTLEVILVRSASGKRMEYISPLLDESGPLSKEVSMDINQTAEAMLSNTVGNFTSDKVDYRDNVVLATSRAIAGTPWKLIVKIDRKEALAKSTERRAGMVLLFFMILAIVALIIATIWWHAHSKRAMMMSRHFRKLAAQTYAQEQLLRLVTDHQPESIFIVDAHQTYQFANKKAAREADMAPDFIPGKTLKDVRGANKADYIVEQGAAATKNNRIIYDLAKVQDGSKERVVRSAFVPLAHIPVASLPDPTPGLLVVEQDVSEVVHERERRINTQNHLIETLVRLVDMRDPFAANHSLLVSQVAHRIAADMELLPALIDTARISGCLMNIGKIVVPAELLTKSSSISREEKQKIQDSMLSAAELIKDIEFDGPVAETLRQWQEKWDGSGPLALRGEAILITARIIAVANAFIGMISPRSWRHAISIEDASKTMLEQADINFDRRVVIALINYVENHKGREWIERILKNKAA